MPLQKNFRILLILLRTATIFSFDFSIVAMDLFFVKPTIIIIYMCMVVLLLFCSVLFRSVFFGEQLEKQDTLTEIYRKRRHGMSWHVFLPIVWMWCWHPSAKARFIEDRGKGWGIRISIMAMAMAMAIYRYQCHVVAGPLSCPLDSMCVPIIISYHIISRRRRRRRRSK